MNSPASEIPDDFPSEEELKEALKDPAFVEGLQAHYRKVLAGEFGEVAPELRAAAEKAMQSHEIIQKLTLVQASFAEFTALSQRPAGTMRAEDRLAEARRIFDELTDAGLELPEPYRTAMLKDVVPVWEKVKAMRVE